MKSYQTPEEPRTPEEECMITEDKAYILAEELATTIDMLRGGRLKESAFLIVEGDSDAFFCKQYVLENKNCEVIVAGNRPIAERILTIVERNNFPGVLAIVDADFDVLRGRSPGSVNLFFTDTHDLETMILKSDALEKFLSVCGDKAKIENFEPPACKQVRELLLETGRWVGYLRWVSLEEELNLVFEKLPFNNFVDQATLSLDLNKLVKAIIGLSKEKLQDHLLGAEELKQKILNKVNSQHELWHVCQGHDLVEILAVGMREVFATQTSRDAHADKLEKQLRLAYEKTWFVETQLYRSLRNWEDHHSPFRVLSISEKH